MNKIVLSLGGSLIAPKTGGLDAAYLKKLREFLRRQIRLGRRFAIVCGGGMTARQYMTAAKEAGRPDSGELDWIGIRATWLNASLAAAALAEWAAPGIVIDPTAPLSHSAKVVVAGGWKPGWSTDYDAVLIARNFGADTVINLSDIAWVYDADPRKDPAAKPLPRISWPAFRKMFGAKWIPGMNAPFDPLAAIAAAKQGTRVVVADGRDLKNLSAILDGRKFKGTVLG